MRNAYFIAFNRYLIKKSTTKYSKSQQTTEAEAGHFLYFDCKDKGVQLVILRAGVTIECTKMVVFIQL